MPRLRPYSVAWTVETSGILKACLSATPAKATSQSWAWIRSKPPLSSSRRPRSSIATLVRQAPVKKSGMSAAGGSTRCTIVESETTSSPMPPAQRGVNSCTSTPERVSAGTSSVTCLPSPPTLCGGYSHESMRTFMRDAPLGRAVARPAQPAPVDRKLATGRAEAEPLVDRLGADVVVLGRERDPTDAARREAIEGARDQRRAEAGAAALRVDRQAIEMAVLAPDGQPDVADQRLLELQHPELGLGRFGVVGQLGRAVSPEPGKRARFERQHRAQVGRVVAPDRWARVRWLVGGAALLVLD